MITEAILALEMEVQRNPTNPAAWQALGQAHAENDKDNLAIISLEKAVQVDPENLDALAALAVSYTNDFTRDKALDTLETWLSRNAEYAHISPAHAPHPPQGGTPDFYTESWSRHARVVDMFLEAAQLRPSDPDPEVQTALGLLYNLSYEYDRAVDCFKVFFFLKFFYSFFYLV
jgi:peroxin-5